VSERNVPFCFKQKHRSETSHNSVSKTYLKWLANDLRLLAKVTFFHSHLENSVTMWKNKEVVPNTSKSQDLAASSPLHIIVSLKQRGEVG
jgi:hypothetical protein